MTTRRRIERLERRSYLPGNSTPKPVEVMSDAELIDRINQLRIADGLRPWAAEPTDTELEAEITRLERR